MRCHDRIAFATPAVDCRIFCSFGKNVNEIRVVCVWRRRVGFYSRRMIYGGVIDILLLLFSSKTCA